MCCKWAQLVQFWWDPREFHLDKPSSRGPCTTQQFPKQTQPWWGCTQWRQSCRVREPSGHCPGWKPSASAWAGHTSSGCCCQKDSWVIIKALSKSRGIRENLPTLPPRSCLQCLEDVEKRRERPLCMDDISTSPVRVFEYSENFLDLGDTEESLCIFISTNATCSTSAKTQELTSYLPLKMRKSWLKMFISEEASDPTKYWYR